MRGITKTQRGGLRSSLLAAKMEHTERSEDFVEPSRLFPWLRSVRSDRSPCLMEFKVRMCGKQLEGKKRAKKK